MAVKIADTLGTMGQGGYPLVNAADVAMASGETLEEAMEHAGGMNPDDLDNEATDEETEDVFGDAGAYFDKVTTQKVSDAFEGLVIPKIGSEVESQVNAKLPQMIEAQMEIFKTTLDDTATEEEVEEVFA